MNDHPLGEVSAAMMGVPQIAAALSQLAARVGETTIVLDRVGQCTSGTEEAQRVWTELRGEIIADSRAWSLLSNRQLLISAWGIQLG